MDVQIDGQTIGSVLRQVESQRKDDLFIMCEDESRTYTEFMERVDRISKGLLAIGVKKDDKVALWAGNSVEWIECYFAVVGIGAILVTVNTRYHISELSYQLKQSDTKFLILDEQFLKEDLLNRLVQAVPELKTEEFGEVESAGFPCFKGAVTLEKSQKDYPGVISLDELIERGERVSDSALEKAQKEAKPEDVALMIYTSGTTGEPKGVELQHFALLERMSRYCTYNRMTEEDSTFFALPLFHAFGVVVAVLGTLVTGSRLCMLDKFRAREALELINTEKCTIIHGVPSSFYMMLNDPEFDRFDLSCGRTGVLGGRALQAGARSADNRQYRSGDHLRMGPY
ncbi:MAG: AMP-binding protein [Eggerthellaceae bacterium]|nr:AMP-binding protein [Eggerthellaceae bacterium]